MTDPTSPTGGPTDTPNNQAVIERTLFQKTAIWLPQYAVVHFNAGIAIIKGKVFEDCLFEGPGVILAGEGNVFESCNLGVSADPASLLMRPVGPMVTGTVPFEDCRFVRCRFLQIAFTGHEPFMAEFAAMQTRGMTQ